MSFFARVFCASLALLPGLLAAGPDSLLIQSFEKPADLGAVHAISARVARVPRNATHGKFALEAVFAAEAGAAVELRPARADWRKFGAAALSVTNTSREAVEFAVEVEDARGAKVRGVTNLGLLPGESGRYALPLSTANPLDMGMRGEPNLPGFRLLKSDYNPVALDRVAVLRIVPEAGAAGRTLMIDDVRLVPGVDYDRIVDRLGQYTREEWPGKMKSAEEFASYRAQEESALAAHPALADRDEYGGWASGPKLESTGYFRAAKHGGKWWLVTPGGRLFFSLGLNEVDYRGQVTVIDGRRADVHVAAGGAGSAGLALLGPLRRGARGSEDQALFGARLQFLHGEPGAQVRQGMAGTVARFDARPHAVLGHEHHRKLVPLGAA